MKTTPVLPAALALCATLWGCSAAGFVAGTIVDCTDPDSTFISRGELRQVTPGTRGTLIMTNGWVYDVEVLAVRDMGEEAYANRYAAAREHLSARIRLPDIREEVLVTTATGSSARCLFTGFDDGRLQGLVGVEHAPAYVYLTDAIRIQMHNGETLKLDTLGECLQEGLIPDRSELRVRLLNCTSEIFRVLGSSVNTGGIVGFPLNEIRCLNRENDHNNKWWGALAGFAADVVWLSVTSKDRW